AWAAPSVDAMSSLLADAPAEIAERIRRASPALALVLMTQALQGLQVVHQPTAYRQTTPYPPAA
ncbi:MAG: hypothetical protein JWQ11_1726, partial [Rhizobacter sp.]|nr:hypothetical protein [Rhizobacter sp.]